jgi:hypothetical protein
MQQGIGRIAAHSRNGKMLHLGQVLRDTGPTLKKRDDSKIGKILINRH